MKQMRHLILVVCVTFWFQGCGESQKEPTYAFKTLFGSQPAMDPDLVDPELVEQAADAQLHFASELYRHLIQDPQQVNNNLIISPFSIFSAFNMLYPGAQGHTAESMRAAFFLGYSDPDIFSGQGALNQIIRAHSTKDASLEMANAAFVDEQFPVMDSYLDTLSMYYDATIYQADFSNDADFMCEEINRWISDRTHQRIRDLLKETDITKDTLMVLVNAIYFNAKWKTSFEEGNEMQFNSISGGQSFTSMKVELEEARLYDSRSDAQPRQNLPPIWILAIPYKDEHFDMLVFLPENLGEFQAGLNADTLGTLIRKTQSATPGEVLVQMPGFRIEWDLHMNDLLKGMGLGPILCGNDPWPDFSAMHSPDFRPVCVSGVIHKAFVEVDRKGTEAAAATAIVVNNTSGPDRPEFKVDRPFFFAIVDRKTRTILFMGHVVTL